MSRIPHLGFRRRKADMESLWLITFADLMVQLMAFFALLYSFGIEDTRKLQEYLESARKAFGGAQASGKGPGTGDRPSGQGLLDGTRGLDPSALSDVEKQLADVLGTDGPDLGTRQLAVSFRGSILFEEGSAVLTEGTNRALDRMADLVKRYPGFTLVAQGHASPGEKSRNGQDAWALSGLRAQAAIRYLAQKGAEPSSMAAEARGDALPDGGTDTPEGMALQRRVVFRFYRMASRTSLGPEKAGAPAPAPQK